jgi:hypothetical protein
MAAISIPMPMAAAPSNPIPTPEFLFGRMRHRFFIPVRSGLFGFAQEKLRGGGWFSRV